MTALKTQAIQTVLTGDFKSAIELNKKLLQENPADIDTLNRLGMAFMLFGKPTDAKKNYQKVLDIDPLNPIALKNLKKIKEKTYSKSGEQNYQINNNFIEQTGKTKIVELINATQPKIIQGLRVGQGVSLSIKRLKIFVQDEKQYIGVLPDDIGKRLIKFIKTGNLYEAYIKSANAHHVIVFLKEVKRSTKLKDQPSFTSISENSLFDKNGKMKSGLAKKHKVVDKEEDEEQYQEDEEE